MPAHLPTSSSTFSRTPSAWLHNPALSLWLSVDPMADKYPGVSPYAYCGNNPVRLVDVDGRKIKPVGENSKEYINEYLQDQFGTSDFIRYSRNGNMKIVGSAYKSLNKKANSHQKTLLKGLKQAIHSTSNAYVEIDNKSRFGFSHPAYIEDVHDKYGFPVPSHDITGYHLVESGLTHKGSNGCYIYINNEGAAKELMTAGLHFENHVRDKDYRPYIPSILYTGESASSVFFHELLDEFLNFFTRHRTSDKSPQIDKVYYQNQALLNKGLMPRDGADHQ